MLVQHVPKVVCHVLIALLLNNLLLHPYSTSNDNSSSYNMHQPCVYTLGSLPALCFYTDTCVYHYPICLCCRSCWVELQLGRRGHEKFIQLLNKLIVFSFGWPSSVTLVVVLGWLSLYSEPSSLSWLYNHSSCRTEGAREQQTIPNLEIKTGIIQKLQGQPQTDIRQSQRINLLESIEGFWCCWKWCYVLVCWDWEYLSV